MTRRRLPLSAAAAATVALTIAALPAAAGGTTPRGVTTVVNDVRPTSYLSDVAPIAATADLTAFGQPWAVFALRNRVGNTPDPTGRLLAVTKAGDVTPFGTDTPDMRSFSLSGYTLTAASSTHPSRVYWWRPVSGPTTTGYRLASVRAGDTYLSSAPDGWVEISNAGQLFDVSAGSSAAPRALGNPFGSAEQVQGVSGPTGIVVWNATRIAFVRFADGQVTQLDTSQVTDLPGGTNTPQCWSVSANAVACGSYYFTGEDDSGFRNLFLDPLDGGVAFANTTEEPGPASVLGRKAAWVTDSGQLRVLGADLLIKSTARIGAWPIAGLGGFLTNDRKRHAGIRLSADTTHRTTVLPAAPARTEATEFALTAGSVVWLESASNGAVVRRRNVARNALHLGVTLGKTHRVAASKALRGELAASGRTFAYPTDLNNSTVGQNGGQTMRVVGPDRTTTIRGVDRYLPVSLGGHWVAYYADERNARLADLSARTTEKLAATGIALNGHWLAYVDLAGTIHLRNLADGTVRTVATNVHLVNGQLFIHGQVVAWNQYPPGSGGHLAFYRDMASSAPAVPLPPSVNVWQASDAGLVLEQSPNPSSPSPGFPEDRAVQFHEAMTFLLLPYGASDATTLLVADYPKVGPQVAGNVLAWIDRYGKLKARALA